MPSSPEHKHLIMGNAKVFELKQFTNISCAMKVVCYMLCGTTDATRKVVCLLCYATTTWTLELGGGGGPACQLNCPPLPHQMAGH